MGSDSAPTGAVTRGPGSEKKNQCGGEKKSKKSQWNPQWLIDCYRLRVDDDMSLAGNVRGLYAASAGDSLNPKLEVFRDFLLFCKLAQIQLMLRTGQKNYDFKALLKEAPKHLACATEKSDCSEKWGAQAPMSLRMLAEYIYGCSCMPMAEKFEGDLGAAFKEIREKFEGDIGAACPDEEEGEEEDEDAEPAWSRKPESKKLFEDVGGVDIWSKFYRKLKI